MSSSTISDGSTIDQPHSSTLPPTKYTKKLFPINDLPFIVRENTFGHLLSHDKIEAFCTGSYIDGEPQFKPALSAISRAGDRQLRLEYLRVFLMHTDFIVDCHGDLADFQSWLASLNFRGIQTRFFTGFDAIRRLTFCSVGSANRYEFVNLSDPELVLIRACTNLGQLTLTFADIGETTARGGSVSAEQEWECLKKRLQGVLSIKGMRILRFKIGLNPGGRHYDEQVSKAEKMTEWVGGEYKKQNNIEEGAKVPVVVLEVMSADDVWL